MGKSPGRSRARGRRSVSSRWPYAFAAVVIVLLATVGRGLVTQHLLQTYTAEVGRIESTIDLRGYLIWREEVITAPFTGQVAFAVACGEQVRTGCVLAEIHNPQTEAAIERQIEEARANLSEFRSLAQEQVQALEIALHETTFDLRDAIDDSRQIQGAQAAHQTQRLLLLWQERSERMDRLKTLQEEESRRQAALKRVEAQRSEATQAVVATMPATVFRALDGLEDTLHWERQERLTARTLFTLALSPSRRQDGETIAAGDPVVKLVDMRDAVWAVATPESHAEQLMIGMRVAVRTEDDVRVQGQITDVRPGSPPGYAVVLVRFTEGAEMLGSERVLAGTLITTSNEGIRIPSSALWEREGQTGVYVVYRAMVQFQPVDVIVIQGGWALVLGLAAGDEIITTPRWVQDGQRAP